MTTTPTPTGIDPTTLRTALVDLLTGHDHNAATPETLAEIGAQRRQQANEPGIPSVDLLCDSDRLAVLVGAVGAVGAVGLVGHALPNRRNPGQLRTALVTLAAITLTWLDHTQPNPHDNPADDEPPF